MALNKGNQIIQDRNNKFLEGVQKIMGDGWKLSCEVTEPQYSYGNQDVKQYVSIEVKNGNTKSGYSFETPAVRLNDECFNKFVTHYDGKRLDGDVAYKLLNRDKIVLANKLQDELVQKQELKTTKKMKL